MPLVLLLVGLTFGILSDGNILADTFPRLSAFMLNTVGACLGGISLIFAALAVGLADRRAR